MKKVLKLQMVIPSRMPVSSGVLFGCRNGFCRTCEIEVLEGYENLTEISENEEFIMLDYPKRLACQCRLLKDGVRIKPLWQ